jgi:predicted transcriptional regulator
MKTQVYSWRVSSELKANLERAARVRKVPVSSILDAAARDWLKKSAADTSEDEKQRRLHSAALSCFGAFAGPTPRRSETARESIRKRLRGRHAA